MTNEDYNKKVDKQLVSIRYLSKSPEWKDLIEYLKDTCEIDTIFANVTDNDLREWIGARNVYLAVVNAAKSQDKITKKDEEVI